MVALILALCALFLCACSEWYAYDGRRIESRENPVQDTRWAEALDREMSADPDADLCAALDAMAVALPVPQLAYVDVMPTLPATPVAMRLGLTGKPLAQPKAKRKRKSRAKPKASVEA